MLAPQYSCTIRPFRAAVGLLRCGKAVRFLAAYEAMSKVARIKSNIGKDRRS